MKGLLIKEYSMMKITVKAQAVSFIIFVLVGLVMKNVAYMEMMLMILMSNLVMNSISLDASSSWNRYALTLPVKRRDLVSVKFVFMYILHAIGMALLLPMAVLFSMIFKLPLEENMLAGIICGILPLFCSSVSILLCTKFGAEKARLLMTLVYMVPFLLIYGLYFAVVQKQWIHIPHIEESEIALYLALASAVVLGASLLCWKLSCAVARKQDW